MRFLLHKSGDQEIAEIITDEPISSAQQFLEIMMNAPADHMVIRKENLHESFFDLRSGLAGEVLQKIANYRRKLGIIGDFSGYNSKSLRDFIYESNKSNMIVFVSTLSDAVQRISK